MIKKEVLDFYAKKKVLITGHTGFKGSWLACWLNMLGADVHGCALDVLNGSLYNKLNLESVIKSNIFDIRDAKRISLCIDEIQPDIIFHLAAQALVRRSYDEPHLTFETNVMGSINLLEAIRDCESVKSLIYITSDKCYWNSEWVWGYRESDPLGGADPYSASKACAEHVFKSYYLSYFSQRKNFGCGSTRAGNVIGGGDYSKNRIVPDIIRAIEEGEEIYLRQPQATRPWQHVLEPLSGYLVLGKHLFENPSSYNGESWNFGPTNQSIKTVLELTENIVDEWEGYSKAKIKIDKSENHPYESTLLHLSIDKAQTLLEWTPRLSFSSTVKLTRDWYDKVINAENPVNVTKDQIDFYLGS